MESKEGSDNGRDASIQHRHAGDPAGSTTQVSGALPADSLLVLKNLTRALGGPRIFMKRKALSSLAMGGNKTRELEYFIGAELADRADTFIAGGGTTRSNHAVQCSAAARRAGLKPRRRLSSTTASIPQAFFCQ